MERRTKKRFSDYSAVFPTESTSGVIEMSHHSKKEFFTEEAAPKNTQGLRSKKGEQCFAPQ